MFKIQRIKRGKSMFVTKIDPVKGHILALTAREEDAPTFTEEQVRKFAAHYEASTEPTIGDFRIYDPAKKRVVKEIEAPEPPVDPIAEQMAANRGATEPAKVLPANSDARGDTGGLKGADTKGHPTGKDLAGSAKQ